MRALDIAGQRFGRLVALERQPSIGRRTAWSFVCDCGSVVVRKLEPVRAGITTSCGCLRAELTAERSRTHGHSAGRVRSRTLRAWDHAKGRCFNKTDHKYPHYGERGITMAPVWAEDFSAFLRDMGECPEGRSLDRIDVNGHYEPGNCRWATADEQSRNRTDNVYVDFEGERLVLKDFALRVGVAYKRLHGRMRRTGDDAITAAKHFIRLD